MFDLSPEEWTAVALSVRIALVATLFALPLGIAVAWLLARKDFWGKALLDGIIHLPLVLPPVVTGYLLLIWFGRRGPIGAFLEQTFGIVFSFRWTGAALACGVMAFPLLVRALVEAGAELILVPSCTDAMPGYHRVRIACAARALENQCFVVQSPTVGEADWSPAVDANAGAANVFGPPDRCFPDDGVIATGALNQPGFVFADIDLWRVKDVRRDGQVLNHLHWKEQPGAGELPEVTQLKLV